MDALSSKFGDTSETTSRPTPRPRTSETEAHGSKHVCPGSFDFTSSILQRLYGLCFSISLAIKRKSRSSSFTRAISSSVRSPAFWALALFQSMFLWTLVLGNSRCRERKVFCRIPVGRHWGKCFMGSLRQDLLELFTCLCPLGASSTETRDATAFPMLI